MARKSKKKLFKTLAGYGFEFLKGVGEQKLEHSAISNETYGRDSRIYIYTPDKKTRRVLECKLERDGYTVNCGYNLKGSTIEVGVSYFQGTRWDV